MMVVHHQSKMTTLYYGVYFAIVALAFCIFTFDCVGKVNAFQQQRTTIIKATTSPSPCRCHDISSLQPLGRLQNCPTTTMMMTKTTDMEHEESNDGNYYCTSIVSPTLRKIMFGSAFLGENILSYTGPGSDGTLFPQQDLDLITQSLMNPNVMSNPPDGSGYGIFSYTLFNSFIYLPLVWAAIILPENAAAAAKKKQQQSFLFLPAWPFLVASTALGGIGLYPYLALRKPMTTTIPNSDDATKNGLSSSFLVSFFNDSIALKVLLVLSNLYLLQIFLEPFLSGNSNLVLEIQGFGTLFGHSQFVFTTTLDAIILSLLLLDPISDDAKRRGVLEQDSGLMETATKLWPFLVPVFGSLFWVLLRPSPVVNVEEND